MTVSCSSDKSNSLAQGSSDNPDGVAQAREAYRSALIGYYTEQRPPLSTEDYAQVLHRLRIAEAAATAAATRDAEAPGVRRDAVGGEAEAGESGSAGGLLTDWTAPSLRVVPVTAESLPRLRHAVPMLSLANAYSQAEIGAWHDGLQRKPLGAELRFVGELKVDGVAISVRYEQGLLKTALTRGDGAFGEVVTPIARTIEGLPHRLAEPLDLEVRGEVYLSHRGFEQLNQRRNARGDVPFANSRNAVSGFLHLIDIREAAEAGLELSIYRLVHPKDGSSPLFTQADGRPLSTHWETLQWLRSLGFPVHSSSEPLADLEALRAYYERWGQARQELPLPVDGVVIKVDSLDLQEKLSTTGKSPLWAVAVKFAMERATTQILEVQVQVGRTGALTPVAQLRPVALGGTTVLRATLNNFEYVAHFAEKMNLELPEGVDQDLKIRDWVVVEKGGEVIPKVVDVHFERRDENITAIDPPQACPSCATPPVLEAGQQIWRCVNPLCPAQQAARIAYFVSRKAMDIQSIGPSLIQRLIAAGHLKTVASLYRLTAPQLESLEGVGAKSAANVIRAIEASKTPSLENFLVALGIRFLGAETARLLAREFGSLAAIREANQNRLQEGANVGQKVAESVHAFFDQSTGDNPCAKLVDELLGLGVTPREVVPEAEEEGPRPLAGKEIVITGILLEPRERWKTRLKQAGATVTNTVKKKNTDILLVGNNPGNKLEMAKKYGKEILTEAEMRERLEIS